MQRAVYGESRSRRSRYAPATRPGLAEEQWPSRTRLLFLVGASLFLWLLVLRLGLALS